MDSPALVLALGIVEAIVIVAAVYWLGLKPLRERELRSLDSYRARLDEEANARSASLVLEAKRVALQIREDADKELREAHASLDRLEARLCTREEALDAQRDAASHRETELNARERLIADEELKVGIRLAEAQAGLEALTNLSPDSARDLAISRAESEITELIAAKTRELEDQAIHDVNRRARGTILDAIQRLAVECVTEATTAIVELASEDLKGRIIGREGRNIRAFETVTGVDLVVDESPNSVAISTFDPIRREIAKLTLQALILDGRIHPARIEELHERAKLDVHESVCKAGGDAAYRAKVAGLHPQVIEALGRLKYRTSYAQNVLDHSVEVASLCAILAAELGLNVEIAKRAGLLHDIGKALGPEWEGPHALTGMAFLSRHGEGAVVTNAVGAHHAEIAFDSLEAQIVAVADSISAARPGAREESLDSYLKRLTTLEEIASSFAGVDRSYAVQAGREVRLFVRPEEIDDLGAVRLAAEVARKIEDSLQFPGQIRVTVIRETRAQHVAR